jgi:hypothetical protein
MRYQTLERFLFRKDSRAVVEAHPCHGG